jgi:hypothetical protein
MNGRAHLFGQLLHILVLTRALSVAIVSLDLRGPNPDVPRHVRNEPSERDLWPQGGVPLC